MPPSDSSAFDRARSRAVVHVLVWTLLGNYAVAGAKLAYGAYSGSLSFTADGIHSLLDGTSNIVGIVGMRAASQPPDEGHPYGHQRFEALAALAIGALILVGLYEITSRAVLALIGGGTSHAGWEGIGIAGGTLVVNVAVARYETRRGKELKSPILTADAGHTTSDSLGTLVVIVGTALSRLGLRYADAGAAAIIAVLVARTAWAVLRDNVGVLADARRVDAGRVRALACGVEGVRGAHKIRSRGTVDHVAVDLHIHVDPEMTVEEAHSLTHRVADRIKEELTEVRDVVIHTEPADGREGKG